MYRRNTNMFGVPISSSIRMNYGSSNSNRQIQPNTNTSKQIQQPTTNVNIQKSFSMFKNNQKKSCGCVG